MKKFFLGLIGAILIAVVNLNLVYADVNDFTITDFKSDFYLAKDSKGRSTLKTVESITALFPEFDQNHGIERAIPLRYDNHSVNLNVVSVNDESANSMEYSTYKENGNLVVRIGNADTYVHGLKTYVITYTQRDVTKYFAGEKDDEFYWDVNGTGWRQQVNSITARLHLDSSLAKSLNGKQTCYFGAQGSAKRCSIGGAAGVITAMEVNLAAGENMTIAVGFKPHTFVEYQKTVLDYIGMYSSVISASLGAMSLLAVCYVRFFKCKSAPSKHAIVNEFLPPKDADVALSAEILNRTGSWVPATYIDLAVRHNIKIVELEKKLFLKQGYRFELLSTERLSRTEYSILNALFGSKPTVGDQYEIKPTKFDRQLVASISSVRSSVVNNAKDDGYFMPIKNQIVIMYSLLAFIMLQFIGAVVLFGENSILFTTESIVINIIAFVVALIVTVTCRPLSQKGRELHDYLKGLERYIGIGEQDRLRVLQSPEGAEKTPIDTNDKEKLVHLYERLLPYAMIFGMEKSWSKALGNYYDQSGLQPDWYVGNNTFNAVMFSSSMSSFSSTSNSYSNPISSSSGGSGGGGFSGGGGGGGGGGGW